ncbi:DUF5707 domain-containing protein [Streptomyces beijiangensis]|uniref:Calcium-binding protein n=1 Tax=Streptomyces beijiangensis TaxID=163361 RepID=A0A939F222_9ACTN|nr:DUF5707 domain-containing protein [Streptomyces beijiangensis]MBO0510775.1 calcium-binding protein [Streptomyces beijiangensis]
MRTRANAAAVIGALALSALALPSAAQADTQPSAAASRHMAAFAAKSGPGDTVNEPTQVTKVLINGGKDIVVGVSATVKVKVAITVTDPKGVSDADVFLWHGSTTATSDGFIDTDDISGDNFAKCVAVNATTSNCSQTISINPKTDLWAGSASAGSWKVSVAGIGNTGGFFQKSVYQTQRIQRASRLTVNAAPEPVKKGKPITATGKLDRANWDDFQYHGYASQPVKLQFRKKNSSTYTTVKTIKTNVYGNLKTTVKAVQDGYWRYVFTGTSTTPAVTTAGDYVDVR